MSRNFFPSFLPLLVHSIFSFILLQMTFRPIPIWIHRSFQTSLFFWISILTKWKPNFDISMNVLNDCLFKKNHLFCHTFMENIMKMPYIFEYVCTAHVSIWFSFYYAQNINTVFGILLLFSRMHRRVWCRCFVWLLVLIVAL